MPLAEIFLRNIQTNPQFFWAVCITVVFSITVHELSHGVVAIAMGDRTPIETGHMTPNPMTHMGLMSLILLLLAGIAWGQMPVNPSRMRGRHAAALVALAGPVSNVIMAGIALAGLGLWQRHLIQSGVDQANESGESISYFLWVFGVVNVALAIFNILPVPPLDGSRVLADLSPGFRQLMQSMRQGGGAGIVFLLVFIFAGNIIFPAAGAVSGAFLGLVRGH